MNTGNMIRNRTQAGKRRNSGASMESTGYHPRGVRNGCHIAKIRSWLPLTRWLAASLEVEECTTGDVVGFTMSHAVDQRTGI